MTCNIKNLRPPNVVRGVLKFGITRYGDAGPTLAFLRAALDRAAFAERTRPAVLVEALATTTAAVATGAVAEVPLNKYMTITSIIIAHIHAIVIYTTVKRILLLLSRAAF